MKKMALLGMFLAFTGSAFAQNADRMTQTPATSAKTTSKAVTTHQSAKVSEKDTLTHMEHAQS